MSSCLTLDELINITLVDLHSFSVIVSDNPALEAVRKSPVKCLIWYGSTPRSSYTNTLQAVAPPHSDGKVLIDAQLFYSLELCKFLVQKGFNASVFELKD